MHNTLRERNVFGSLWKRLQMNNKRTVVKSTMCILNVHQVGIHRIAMMSPSSRSNYPRMQASILLVNINESTEEYVTYVTRSLNSWERRITVRKENISRNRSKSAGEAVEEMPRAKKAFYSPWRGLRPRRSLTLLKREDHQPHHCRHHYNHHHQGGSSSCSYWIPWNHLRTPVVTDTKPLPITKRRVKRWTIRSTLKRTPR